MKLGAVNGCRDKSAKQSVDVMQGEKIEETCVRIEAIRNFK
jgi:hypothetical protein